MDGAWHVNQYSKDGQFVGLFTHVFHNEAPISAQVDKDGNVYILLISSCGAQSIEKFSATGEDLGKILSLCGC